MGIINYSHFAMKTFVPLVAIFAIIAIGQQASALTRRLSLECTKHHLNGEDETHYLTLYEGGNGKCELQRRTEICTSEECGETPFRPQRGDCSDVERIMNNDSWFKKYCPGILN